MPFINIKNNYSAGKIHFVGIGGIGMSAIALILKQIGCDVQGSDLSSNNNIINLESNGIKCFIGHSADNITDDVALIVETSIVKTDNPEIIQAKAKNIPIIRRADMLAAIMQEKLGITVAGTHGKTSTTAMIAVLLASAGLDPTVINGGIINYFGSNAKFGDGEFLVAESDESDASFVDLPSFIGVVNNIEPEHLEFYNGDFELVKNYFRRYVMQIPDNGLGVLFIDDLEVKKLYDDVILHKSNIVSLSINDVNADFFGFDFSFAANGLQFCVKIKQTGQIIKDIKMPIYGVYNIKNALAPVAIGVFLGLDELQIKQGLASYSGVQRRFTKVGEVDGITIIDDYGHHPTEIQATFKAARTILANNQLIAVFQPHKYTRTRDLFDEFCHSFVDVDIVIIADIYSAGQQPIEGFTADNLVDRIKRIGHKNVIKLNSENDLPQIIKEQARAGDMVICIGAGSISKWANDLPEKLREIVRAGEKSASCVRPNFSMSSKITIKKLGNKEEVATTFPILTQHHQHINLEDFLGYIDEILAEKNYQMIAAYLDGKMVGIAGYWVLTRFYLGKYIHIGNMVVDEGKRSLGIGKLMLDFIEQEGREQNCQHLILDSKLENKKAHSLYLRDGFEIIGYHFMKDI